MLASSSPLGNPIRYAIWLANIICVISECDRISRLSRLCTSPPNFLLRTVLELSAPLWALVGPPSLVVFLHIYQTPTLAITTQTRELFHDAVVFYALHIFGLISEAISDGQSSSLALSIGLCLLWQWSVYLEQLVLARPKMAEAWFLSPVDGQMRQRKMYEKEEGVKLPTKKRGASVDFQITNERDSTECKDNVKGLTKRVARPAVAYVMDGAVEDESDLAKEWIRLPVDAES